ncbi:heat-labile enterotoxin alpha chain domain-containing protein [Hirsutella rhossiliensis]
MLTNMQNALFAILIPLVLCITLTSGQPINEPVNLYRFDAMGWNEVQKRGGFRPWGANYDNPPFGLGETGKNVIRNNKFSLYQNTGSSSSGFGSMYTSTSYDPKVSLGFSEGKEGTLYRIRPSPNAIDVASSLGAGYPPGLRHEKEVSFLGGVYKNQIVEYAVVPKNFKGNVEDFKWQRNQNYDRRFDTMKPVTAPQLAGFPSHLTFPDGPHAGQLAVETEPWKSHQGSLVNEAKKIRLQTNKEIGWTKNFPFEVSDTSTQGGQLCKRGQVCSTHPKPPGTEPKPPGTEPKPPGTGPKSKPATGGGRISGGYRRGATTLNLAVAAVQCFSNKPLVVQQEPPPPPPPPESKPRKPWYERLFVEAPVLAFNSFMKLFSKENSDAFMQSAGDFWRALGEMPEAIKSSLQRLVSAENLDAFKKSTGDLVTAMKQIPAAVASGANDIVDPENFDAFGKSLTDLGEGLGEIPGAFENGFNILKNNATQDIAMAFQKLPAQVIQGLQSFMNEVNKNPGSNGRKIIDSVLGSIAPPDLTDVITMLCDQLKEVG